MKLTGIISTIMSDFLCLRGVASIRQLADNSQSWLDVQRTLMQDHREKIAEFLKKGNYKFFPEVILTLNLEENDSQKFLDFKEAVLSPGRGVHRQKIGNSLINISVDWKPLVDGEHKKIKIANLELGESSKLYRIDGNHRLAAANDAKTDDMVAFCVLLFENEEKEKQCARAIFHHINANQRPLKSEENLRVIIDGKDIYKDEELLKFGNAYKLTREITSSENFDNLPKINKLIKHDKYTFFVDLFEWLEKETTFFNEGDEIRRIREQLTSIEMVFRETEIIAENNNVSVLGALAYYKLTDEDKFKHFIQWVKRNHINEAEKVSMSDIVNIYNKIYENRPEKVFLARWYPADGEEKQKADARLAIISEVVKELGLDLEDMGTKEGGTFDIRSVMYNKIRESDIFIADLTGARHNVMVEVGYALRHVELGRMLFYFQKCSNHDKPPFDLNGFKYHPISDSNEIRNEPGVKGDLITILSEIKTGTK